MFYALMANRGRGYSVTRVAQVYNFGCGTVRREKEGFGIFRRNAIIGVVSVVATSLSILNDKTVIKVFGQSEHLYAQHQLQQKKTQQ